MAVADRTLQILPGGQSAAPFSYVLPASTSFTLLAVRATLDGTLAPGAFLPCVQLVSDSGVVMAQAVGGSVAAGGSADVTFAPFLDSATAGAGGGGIQFDVDNEGGGLAVRTNAPSVFGFYGTDVRDTGNGINIEAEGNGSVLVGADGSGQVNVYATSGDLTLGTTSGGFDLTVGTLGNGMILDNNSTADTVITADGATANMHLRAYDTIDILIANGGSGQLTIQNLPTVNPGGSNRVWNDGGTLKIT